MPLVFACADGISPPTISRGKSWAGHSSPSKSAFRLRGGYSPTLVRFTHRIVHSLVKEGSQTLRPTSFGSGYLGRIVPTRGRSASLVWGSSRGLWAYPLAVIIV